MRFRWADADALVLMLELRYLFTTPGLRELVRGRARRLWRTFVTERCILSRQRLLGWQESWAHTVAL